MIIETLNLSLLMKMEFKQFQDILMQVVKLELAFTSIKALTDYQSIHHNYNIQSNVCHLYYILISF